MGWSFASFLKPGMTENSVISIFSLHQTGRSAKISFWHGNKYTLDLFSAYIYIYILLYILDNSVHQNQHFKVIKVIIFFLTSKYSFGSMYPALNLTHPED